MLIGKDGSVCPQSSIFQKSLCNWLKSSGPVPLTVLLFSFKRKIKHKPPSNTLIKSTVSLVNDIALCIWLFLLLCVFNVLLKNAMYVRNSHKHTVGLLTPKYTSCSKCEISQICTCHINYISKAFSKGWEWRAQSRIIFLKIAYLILSLKKVE